MKRGLALIFVLTCGFLNCRDAVAYPYKIRLGDTPAKMLCDAGPSLKAFLEANPGIDPERLDIGRVVEIPVVNLADYDQYKARAEHAEAKLVSENAVRVGLEKERNELADKNGQASTRIAELEPKAAAAGYYEGLLYKETLGTLFIVIAIVLAMWNIAVTGKRARRDLKRVELENVELRTKTVADHITRAKLIAEVQKFTKLPSEKIEAAFKFVEWMESRPGNFSTRDVWDLLIREFGRQLKAVR